MTPEEIAQKKTKKAKISFVIAGILGVLTLVSWIPAYILHVDILPVALSVIFGLIFPFLFLPFFITGIYTWSTRNTLSKDEKIEELEKRLDKIEKSKSQTDDSSEDKNQEPNIPKDNKDSFKASAKFIDDEEEK